MRHQIKANALLNIMQKSKHQYLKGYRFYRKSYFFLTKEIIVTYTIVI